MSLKLNRNIRSTHANKQNKKQTNHTLYNMFLKVWLEKKFLQFEYQTHLVSLLFKQQLPSNHFLKSQGCYKRSLYPQYRRCQLYGGRQPLKQVPPKRHTHVQLPPVLWNFLSINSSDSCFQGHFQWLGLNVFYDSSSLRTQPILRTIAQSLIILLS